MPIKIEPTINIGIIIASIAVLVSIFSVIVAYKRQRISFIHSLVKIRFEVYKKIKDEKRNERGERVGNFFEYLAILVIKKQIPKKISEELFKDDFKIFFKSYKDLIKKNKSWKKIYDLKEIWNI